MNKYLFPLLLLIFISTGYYFLSNAFIYENGIENANEENTQILELEKMMLADPKTGEIPEGMTFKNLAFLRELQKGNLLKSRKERGATWTNRGPWNVGGRTRGMCIDVNDENHLIAGAVSGGIWQSFDAGHSWTRVSPVNGHPGFVSISQDTRPGKTNIWYALSGEMDWNSASGGNAYYFGDGALKSLDNGTTWVPIASTTGATPNQWSSNYQTCWRIAASPVDSLPACLYMATYGAIYRSKDTGKAWKVILNAGNNRYTDVKVSSKGIVYASISTETNGNKGLYRFGNGVNFTNITPPFMKSAGRTVIEINPNNENEVYFLSELPTDSSGGVVTANFEGSKEYVSLLKYNYVSGDGTGTGGLWTNLSGNLPVNAVHPFDKFNCQGGYDLFIKMQPGSNTLFIGGTNIYRSTDAFTTSQNITQIGGYGIGSDFPFFSVYLNHHPDQHDLLFLKSDPKKAYSINDGGIMFTENINAPVVEWQNRSMGYVTSQFYTVAIDEVNAYDPWLLGGFQDNGNYISNSINPTHKWVMPVNGDGAYNYIAPDKSFYVMSTQLGRMVKVELDKHGYLLARRRIDPIGFKQANYGFINPFVVDQNDDNYLYLPIGKKIARLNNLRSIAVNNDYSQLKKGWDVLTDTVTILNDSVKNAILEITALAISKKPANILYVGTNAREMFRIENANSGDPKLIRLDTGATKKLPNGGYVSSIAIDPDSAQHVLICYSNYGISSLFYSKDYGNNWFYVGGNLEGSGNPTGGDPSIRCVNILVDKNGKRIYFAGTSIGLFSTDTLILSTSNAVASNITNWKQESPEEIGAAVVKDIKVRHSDGYVVIGTHGNGAFESYYSGSPPPYAVTSASSEVTTYPNPATDKIYFTFDATNSRNYKAEVYDINGRRMNALTNGINNNNIFTQVLDVSHYPAGHYFMSYYTSDKRKQVKHFIVKH